MLNGMNFPCAVVDKCLGQDEQTNNTYDLDDVGQICNLCMEKFIIALASTTSDLRKDSPTSELICKLSRPVNLLVRLVWFS